MNCRSRFVAALTAVAIFSSCATTQDSVLLGASLGAGTGGGTQLVAGNRSAGSLLIGTAAGAAVGGLIGYLIRKANDKGERPVSAPPSNKALAPFLTKPEVRSLWMPDKIEDDGRRYIEGHRVFFIEKQSTFSQ